MLPFSKQEEKGKKQVELATLSRQIFLTWISEKKRTPCRNRQPDMVFKSEQDHRNWGTACLSQKICSAFPLTEQTRSIILYPKTKEL